MQYIANGAVAINGTEYPHGAIVEVDDTAIAGQLRKLGALLLPNEVQSPEQVASDMAALQGQNAQLFAHAQDLEAQLAALVAQMQKPKGKAKDAPTDDPAV